MRPVNKLRYTTNQIEYKPYGNAKPFLIDAIGKYCSFCEREGFSSSLDVEHIEYKDTHRDKEFLWSNFLLACKNCNSIKGTTEIIFENIILPHLQDTFSPFEYLESGYIKIKDEVSDPLRTKVIQLIDLVGLDRRPGSPKYSTKDDRWQERKQSWELSQKYLKKYTDNKCDIETIVDLSKNVGFWSIWMNTFKNFPIVQKALIDNFSGTNLAFFNQ
ncbi:HNH endonuclease [Flavobacterium chilense]|uniref:TIGR02646 family protein n=1 Tax=Flavobacterium chilense TaxID=946677 RepID=A0A1M7KR63_9FLAO|nr:HNH endonuclease [Flavobacterium chilense]SHM67983.1 TIGR02646 family protein [Flavobacterium chilense]